MSPQTATRIKRFTPAQRLFHLLLMLSFLIQAATGLGRMYMETGWGRNLLALFGGYESSRTVHVYVGLAMLIGFAVHVIYLLFKVDWSRLPASLFGPDSLIPRPADGRHFVQHLAWMFGAKRHPEFERWGYWEKFDYWAVFWGMVIIGGTGILLAYPIWSSRFMPGWGLNVAFWIHRIEAVLAIAHVFIIHFFIGHLRRANFPMDHAMFEGSADLKTARHERAAWIGRLESDGALDPALTAGAPAGRRVIYYAFGFVAIAIGLYLLIGAGINATRITW